METKQTLTGQIAAAYLGAKVSNWHYPITKDGRIVGDMRGIILLIENYDVYGQTWGKPVNRETSDCQLILKRLSDISDEDAKEVAKMMGRESYGLNAQLQDAHLMCKCILGELNFFDFSYPIRQIIDFLRSRGYDLGHGSIPSLIDGGIAIDEKTLTQKTK